MGVPYFSLIGPKSISSSYSDSPIVQIVPCGRFSALIVIITV